MRPSALALATIAALLLVPAANGQRAVPRILAWEEAVEGTMDHPLRWPVAAAAAPDGRIAVADAWQSRLLLFEVGRRGWSVVSSVSLPGVPLSVAHDGGRFVLSLRREAALVAAEGERLLLRPLRVPEGAIPGELAPLPDGGFLMADVAGSRIFSFDARGEVRAAFSVEAAATALAAAPGGGAYLAVPEAAQVRRVGPTGALLATWKVPGVGPAPGWPTGLAALPGGGVVLVDRHGGRILVLDGLGSVLGSGSRKGWDAGLLRFPADVALLPDGRIAVVDQGNGRLQLFRRTDEESSR